MATARGEQPNMRSMLVAVLSLVLAPAPLAQDPGDDAFQKQLAAIVPGEEELAWRSIPWRAEFRTALIEADKLGKPVLLWAMNGHPLGQT